MFGKLYILTGALPKEYGMMLSRLRNMRHTGDYDDFLDWTKEDVEPYLPIVKNFISRIKAILSSKSI